MNPKKEIRVLLIGDFLIFRSGLKLLLETEEAIKVSGEAANLTEAVSLIYKVKPDVLLIDSAEINEEQFSSFLAAQTQFPPSIVLTNWQETEKHRQYLLLGMDGLVMKMQTADVLFDAIRKVGDGGVWFDCKLMSETIKQLVHEKKLIPEKLYTYNCAVLTEREREVLTHVCLGMKNKVIAENLFITETTVRHHLTSIFEKLKVSSRLELVVYAFREKLVEMPVEQVESFGVGR